jgi:hypothetical protein
MMKTTKPYRDHLLKEKKETVLAMYRNCERQRNWYERHEVLRTRGVKPLVSLKLELAEFEKTESLEMWCEVFAPNAADGGVIRVLWSGQGHFSVEVTGYETWIVENIRNMHATLGVRVMAERLQIAVNKARNPIALKEVA